MSAVIGFGLLPVYLSTGSSSVSTLPVWTVFLFCAAGSAILEYVTSVLMEKIFDARWWDYSDMPLNINGRICLPATLLFGAAGTFLVKFFIPRVPLIQERIGINNVSPLIWEALSLILMAVFAADFILTIANMTQLVAKLDSLEDEFNTIMDERYKVVGDKQVVIKQKIEEASRSLNTRQKYVLRNIKRKGSHAKEEVTSRFKEYLNSFVSKEKTRIDHE